MTRAAIYARYSSDNQREASIEDQVRLCRALIEREGWLCAEVYADHGISGATTLRPGYQAMLADARAGRFTTVVAESLDRLSRDQEDVAALYKQLGFADVALVTVAEGTVNELHVGLKGTMNALYLKDLAQKTRRGLEGRVRAGKSGGGNAYGYEVVRAVGPDGEPARGERRINEAEADVVRRIFTDYAKGRSPKAIALQLNREGVPGPRGHAWGPSTINGNRARGTGILNNELYTGQLVWNRLRYVKDPRTGKRISRMNPAEQRVIEAVSDLRIVPQDLWERVKARQDDLCPERDASPPTQRPFWDRRRPRHLFSGLMRCGVCGGGYAKISATLFGCSTARNKGTCDNRLNIRRDVLEASVLDGLRHHLMDPDAFEAFAAAFVEETNRLRSAAGAELAAKQRELDRIRRRLKAIVDAIADGMPARTLKDELMTLEAREDALKAEIAHAGQETDAPLLHPNLARLYRDKVARLQSTLADAATRDEAFALIRSLVEEIVLTPEAGALRIDLKGDLGGILSLCAQGKKPAAISRDGLAQMKLVAGAGFEPATFRL